MLPPAHVRRDANWLSAVRYRALKSSPCKHAPIRELNIHFGLMFKLYDFEMLSLKWVNQAALSKEAAREKWDIVWPCALIKHRVIWIREDVTNMHNNQNTCTAAASTLNKGSCCWFEQKTARGYQTWAMSNKILLFNFAHKNTKIS